jgi:hypothetical protein
MRLKLLSVFLLGVLLATVGTAAADSPRNFRAHLNGEGAGTDSLGQGEAIFQFSKDGQTLHYKLIAANIENVLMTHIHLRPAPGQNGSPVLWLYPAGPPPVLIEGRFQGVLAEGTVTADDLVGPLAGMTLEDLRMAIMDGLTYVNLHTEQFGGGEIRGDIH